jgi:hypothetical protein
MLHSYEYEIPSWREELVTEETVDNKNLHEVPYLDSPGPRGSVAGGPS